MAGNALLDLGDLNNKLDGQNQDFWLHLQTDTKLDKYPAKQHARAVATKLGVDQGLLFLAGEKTVLLKDSDQPVPFRQRRYFYYLTGCNESDCYVLYDIAKDLLTLYIPKIDYQHAVWGGAGSTKVEAYAKYDADLIDYTDNMLAKVVQIFARHNFTGNLYLLGETHSKSKDLSSGLAAELLAVDVLQVNRGMRAKMEDKIDTTELKSAIELCRVIKFPHEIELIRRANEISAKAHRAVLENIRDFKSERQIEGIFLDTCISAGAHNQAYNIIAGAGTNAAVLHYTANDAPLDDNQVVLLDAGAEYECYASDVTRSFPVSGHWTDEGKNIYDAVNDMQAQCIARIRPGVHFRDLQILSMAIATRWLLKLGVLHNGTLTEILKAGTIRAFFPHGLGHHVGLEVHDVLHVPIQSKTNVRTTSDLSVYRNTELHGVSRAMVTELYKILIDPDMCKPPATLDSPILEDGMIVTVEPGLYFSEFALSKVYLVDPRHAKFINRKALAKYMPVGGVRIEDDILVTKGGYENLTTAPKGDEALKIIRGEASSFLPSSLRHKSAKSLSTPIPPAATSIDKGKAPLRTLPADMQQVSGIKLASRDWTPQLTEDLSAKCSTDVKQKAADDLPPRDEGRSLIGSFPFAKEPLVSKVEKHTTSQGTSTSVPLEQTDLLKQVAEAQEQTQKLIDGLAALCAPSTRSSVLPDMLSGLQGRELVQGLEYSTAILLKTKEVLAKLQNANTPAHSVPGTSRSQQAEASTIDQDVVASLVRLELSEPSASVSPSSTYARAKYDYDGEKDKGCVIFEAEDIIKVFTKEESGWWHGQHTQTKRNGWFPATYVAELSAQEAAQFEGATSSNPLAETSNNESHDLSTEASEQNSADQIRHIMSEQRLRSVFTKELALLLEATDPANTPDTIESQIRTLLDGDNSSMPCFSGLCMQLKCVHPGIDFGALPGSGMDKLGKMYGQIDESLKKEFTPGHLFYRMGEDEREALLEGRWKAAGVKEEAVAQIGVCGSCRICRMGFMLWDEKWLADNAEDDEDDE